jgi:pyridinium-3,5-biscarboxylic acid mononucleotide synthase
MNRETLKQLLEAVQTGNTSIDEAMTSLRDFPVAELAEATLDTHRQLRRGFPEVVLGEGKSLAQLNAIVGRLLDYPENVLITRLNEEFADLLLNAYPDRSGEYHKEARALVFRQKAIPERGRGLIMVVTAGSSDIPVAKEAALTARLLGNSVETIFDVGVAGLHRILRHQKSLQCAAVIIVVAGMEGALASVVGELVDRPIIAVPTSVGYGASFEGMAALLSMLNACAAGVTVVNIDNGFGAGYAAALMNRGPESEDNA